MLSFSQFSDLQISSSMLFESHFWKSELTQYTRNPFIQMSCPEPPNSSWFHKEHPTENQIQIQKSDDNTRAALKMHLPFEEAYSALRKYPLILRVTSWFRSQCNTSTLLKTVASSSPSLLSLRSSWVTWCRKSTSPASNLLIEFNLADKKKKRQS